MKTSITSVQTFQNIKNMKKILFFAIAIFFLNTGDSIKAADESKNQTKTIKIFYSPEMQNLVSKWSDEFSKLNPSIEVQILDYNEVVSGGDLSSSADLGFLTHPNIENVSTGLSWNVVLGREVIVPVFNTANPMLNKIQEHGITPDELSNLMKSQEVGYWGSLLNTECQQPIKLYFENSESVKTGISNFLNVAQIKYPAKFDLNSNELISFVKNDPFAIGFTNLTNILNLNHQDFTDQISVLPIDRNANGKIDYFENIYNDFQTFARGVWIGKYPKCLYNNIYAVSSAKTADNSAVQFLSWVLTDGQKYLNSNGYSDLAFGERQMKLEKLRSHEYIIAPPTERFASIKAFLVIIIIAFLVMAGLILNHSVKIRRGKNEMANLTRTADVFNESSVNVPEGLYFDKTHTWAFMEQDGTVKIGIDDFLNHVTGPVSRVVMKSPGDKVKKGESVFTLVKNGKQLVIQAPISGKIAEINEDLVTNPSLLSSSPYLEGWVYLIKPSNWQREIQFMAMAKKYKEWLRNEFIRLKDFIAVSLSPNSLEYAHVTLQDGGEIIDHVLSELTPEIWEEFQTNFINKSNLL